MKLVARIPIGGKRLSVPGKPVPVRLGSGGPQVGEAECDWDGDDLVVSCELGPDADAIREAISADTFRGIGRA
jgi:hypothetical protein